MLIFFKRLAAYFRRQSFWFGLILAAIILQTAFRLAMPLAFQAVFDVGIAHQDLDFLWTLFGVMTVFWLVQALASLGQDAAAARAGLTIIQQLRERMYDLVMSLSPARLQKLRGGDLPARFSTDLLLIEQAVVQTTHVVMFSVLNVLLSLGLLIYLDWRLALLTVVGMLAGLQLPKLFSKQAHQANYDRKNSEGRLLDNIQEQVFAGEVIQAFNLNPMMRARFTGQVDQLDRKAMAAYRADALVGRSGSQSASFLQIAILILGGFFVIKGSLTIGTMVAFSALLQNLVAGISHLSGAVPQIVKAGSSMKRVDELFAYSDDRPAETRFEVLPKPDHALSLSQVTFAYPQQRPTLLDVSFEAGRGTRTALVGASGSGKSTLLKLIMGFEEPLAGVMALDGHDAAAYSKSAWREHLSLVPQEPYLFHMSVRDNIRLGNLAADDDAVAAAAAAAGIDDAIRALPEGYATLVGDAGVRLSGGQKQRLAVARAVLRQPFVLVLDEATSALDPKTEREVMAALEQAVSDAVLLTVTHRLQTVVAYEQILVMDAGRIVARGNHQSLLASNDLYRGLWDKQQGFTISADGTKAEITQKRLARIDLFADVEPEALSTLCGLFTSRLVPEKTAIFKKGDAADRFCIIADGMVEVLPYAEGETRFKRMLLDTGDFFGELALLDDVPRSATVLTRTPTLLLELRRDHFHTMMDVSPALRERIKRAARGRRDEASGHAPG
ncbi:ABC transporter transmembrane domain-containing protein [Acanthopleuribacter pedis]|uniref:ATP-binding cassette domain-containing protein n=1 Tax=Acanthopleuribacter pedis TaxID=442870 RepID=A0A8J7U3M2_9BACT|nr:ABC transporter transmembrane domain-containing protein [Acanthopleuribacter pedis]MBO1317406.1 ATP-binding cassette domain-containing protein [Acanthopleuribacter pedis]